MREFRPANKGRGFDVEPPTKTLRERSVAFTFEVFDETGKVITLRSLDDIEAFLSGMAP